MTSIGISRQRILDDHNNFRAKHGCPPLTESPELTEKAQRWAEHLSGMNALQHSTESGENIGMIAGGEPRKVVSMWYNEVENYDYNSGGNLNNTGHFTQVIWTDSTEIGIGIGQSESSTGNIISIVVCQYNPPGNVRGEFSLRTVPKPVNIITTLC